VHHLSLDTISVALAYIVSVAGSVCALLCVGRIRASAGTPDEIRWLVSSAVALGGVAIWLMHFIAMLSYGLTQEISFSIGLTATSVIIAILVSGAGVFVVTRSEEVSVRRLLSAGAFTGLGITAMHYTGMEAIRVQAEVSYDQRITVLSGVIAIVAATAALWLATTVRRSWSVVAAAFAMGVAVCGMHYTGMAAVTLKKEPEALSPHGAAEALSFVLPIFLSATLVLFILLFMLLSAVDEEEMNRRPAKVPGGHRRPSSGRPL
jgi:NO-binding membrane sensor protein with MHYT domain